MKYLCIFFLFLLLSSENKTIAKKQLFTQSKFELLNQKFFCKNNNINNAFIFLKKNENVIMQELKDNQIEKLSICFPELLRYNLYRDEIEYQINYFTTQNNIYGLTDMSIGPFQMKPSFIKKMETYISIHNELNYLKPYILNNKASPTVRVFRLKSLHWQLKYLNLFWIIMEHKFQFIKFINLESKIRLYSTAYNLGFDNSYQKIRDYQSSNNKFPINQNEEIKSFSDYSILFYNQTIN